MSRSVKPKVIDVFAGVGGFSLGAVRAGFDLVAAIDLDKHAAETHKKNFPKTAHARRDVLQLSGSQLRELGKLNGSRLAGLIGGPPCQQFSPLNQAGRLGLQPLAANLIPEFERCIAQAQPAWFVMENVREAPLPAIKGYEVRAELLNNRWLGEVQNRLRRFSFGTRAGARSEVDNF